MSRPMSRCACLLFAAVFALAACESPPPEGRVEPPDREEMTGAANLSGSRARPEPSPRPESDAAAPGSERAETFHVHLHPGSDPRALARRHGLEPTEVITGPRPGLVVPLTRKQEAAVRADTLVRSLAREIDQGEAGGGGSDLEREGRL